MSQPETIVVQSEEALIRTMKNEAEQLHTRVLACAALFELHEGNPLVQRRLVKELATAAKAVSCL